MIKHLEALDAGPRCRRWVLRAGPDKQRRRSRRFDGTKREALAALDAFADEVASGKVRAHNPETFADYADMWLDRLARGGSVDSQTVAGYRWRINALAHVIGDMRLQSIAPRTLEDAYARMLAGESKSGKPLSGTFVRDCHAVARRMLESAADDGLIARNPADRAAPPKRDGKPRTALGDMEIRLLLAMLPTDYASSVAVALAVTTGLRRGEICALRWLDVDLQNGTLEAARAARKDGTIKDTKTRAGRRVVPLPDAAVDILREWRKARPNSEFVICAANGEPLKPNAITHYWERHRAQFGCEGITLHELRHSYITSLARAGVHPRVMQELAGHASARQTMEIYTHVTLDDKRAAVRSLGL